MQFLPWDQKSFTINFFLLRKRIDEAMIVSKGSVICTSYLHFFFFFFLVSEQAKVEKLEKENKMLRATTSERFDTIEQNLEATNLGKQVFNKRHIFKLLITISDSKTDSDHYKS